MRLDSRKSLWVGLGVGLTVAVVLVLLRQPSTHTAVAEHQSVSPDPSESQGAETASALNQKQIASAAFGAVVRSGAESNSVQTKAGTKTDTEQQVLLARRWAENDAPGTAAWVETLGAGDARSRLEEAIAVIWANHSPLQAVDWARKLSDENEKSRALLSIAGEVGRDHPTEALEIAGEAGESSAKNDALQKLISESVHQFPENAEALLKSLRNHPAKEALSATALVAWADVDPVAAGKFAVENLSPGKALNDATLGIVQRWAQKEPANAESWARQFPDGEVKDTAITEAVRLWAVGDSTAAQTFLESLPAGHERDVATRGLLQSMSTTEIAQARQFVSQIDSPTLRAQETLRLNDLQPSAPSQSESRSVKVE